jgi:hypothetical protein
MTTGHNIPGWQSDIQGKANLLVCKKPFKCIIGMVTVGTRGPAQPSGYWDITFEFC